MVHDALSPLPKKKKKKKRIRPINRTPKSAGDESPLNFGGLRGRTRFSVRAQTNFVFVLIFFVSRTWNVTESN